MMDDEEPFLEKTMITGEVMTLANGSRKGWYDVDQWDNEGNNRWHRQYDDYAKAKAEYDRWN